MTTLALQDFFPQLAGWVGSLDDTFPGKQIKPYFAQFEVGHILSLILLGGSSILLNLRLLGAGLTEETPAQMHRNIRLWMNVGVIGIVVTGLLIGSANAERLYTSEAFTAKMIGLLAAIILTYGVSLPAAKADGLVGPPQRIAAFLGLAIFAVALWVFFSAKLSNPGLWHVVMAASLMVLYVTRGALRWVYLGGLVILIAVQQWLTHITIKPDDYASLDPVNKAFGFIFLAWVALAAIVQIVRRRRDAEAGAFVRAMAYAALLVWVMTAAAGRWLAFA